MFMRILKCDHLVQFAKWFFHLHEILWIRNNPTGKIKNK